MHELSLAMSVREIVEEAAQQNGATKVNRVNLAVGEFSSVSIDALEFAMEVVKKDSVFENAAIVIRSERTILECAACGSNTVMADYVFVCGKCSSGAVRIVSGDRMYVESIDIENGGE
ncbi:MAG TPA: hydrogenase maturation nickel metallochaperone HypA [Spirochaetota bacterium]|nr:hydrogenase maturation nickel metallochaperone HypA [Spirochaetota bacterium]HQO39206.1 hydrogenase maturation nickel metallochaperone HypA [Spirochaetota bacterium]